MLKRVKKICEIFKRGIRKIRDPWWRAKCNYIKYYDSLPIDEHSILLESQHGKEMNGNVFYLIRYLSKEEKYKDYKIYLSARLGKVKSFENVLRSYGLDNVKITVLSSKEYFQILASAKYLINDNTFLPFFIKKEGQIYLNTWHGTPLKSLGKEIKNDAHAIGNAQKNFVTADYLLYPNEYTRDVMIRDYMIENISNGSYVIAGYPRNEVFFDTERRSAIRDKHALNGKRVYAYMPTFRGVARDAGTSKNTFYLNYYLYELDKMLQEDEVLYLNLHPIAKKDVDFKEFKHIKNFPANYETYDFLNATDVLVTDYSSVFFDYASSRRKIVLFTYDKQEYLADRGMYMSMAELPFPQVTDVENLLHEMRTEKNYDDSTFVKTYCKYESATASQKLCDYVILGEENGLRSIKIPDNGKENVLLYAGNLGRNGITASLRALLGKLDLNKRNYYFAFYSENVKKNRDVLFTFPANVNYYAMTGDANLSIEERIIRKLFRKKWIKADLYMKLLGHRVKQNLQRCLGNARFDTLVQFNGYEQDVILAFSTFKGKKVIFVHNNVVREINDKGNQRFDVLHYAYPRYDKVAIVTEDMRAPTCEVAGETENIQVVKNIIDYQAFLEKSKKEIELDKDTKSTMPLENIRKILSDDEKEVFINIGRFAPEKGHERLIDAFKRYICDHDNAYLIVMGGYSLDDRYNKLKNKVKELGVEERVILLENVSNPYPILKACNYFVFSSYFESFGLVLAEADILGIPVISTDILGPRGFMKKYGGTLVEDSEDGIYEGMKMLHEGRVNLFNVDYEEYNQSVIAEFESVLRS